MADYKHWCGNCQIKVYIQRHYGRTLTWADCPYTCEYATAMRCSTECGNEADRRTMEMNELISPDGFNGKTCCLRRKREDVPCD